MVYQVKCRVCSKTIEVGGMFELRQKERSHLSLKHPEIVEQDDKIRSEIDQIRKLHIKPLEQKLIHFDMV